MIDDEKEMYLFIISVERVVSLEMIHATLYQHNQERIEKNAIKPNLIRYAETSMKTGLGLQYIYDYLGIPFLQLQVRIKKKNLSKSKFNLIFIYFFSFFPWVECYIDGNI